MTIDIYAYDKQYDKPVIDSYEQYQAAGGHLDYSTWYSITGALLEALMEESPMWPEICRLRQALDITGGRQ